MDQGNKENTYVLEPKEEERFQPCKVQAILKDVLVSRVGKEKYSQAGAQALSEDVLKCVRERIQENLKMPRYKLCFQVVIGELLGQGVRITHKCLWDSVFDNYSSYTHTNESLFATVICFGCYYE